MMLLQRQIRFGGWMIGNAHSSSQRLRGNARRSFASRSSGAAFDPGAVWVPRSRESICCTSLSSCRTIFICCSRQRPEVSLERARAIHQGWVFVSAAEGGEDSGVAGGVFTNHRIRDAEDCGRHCELCALESRSRRGWCGRQAAYPFSSASPGLQVGWMRHRG